jgi:chromosome partitioning protein
MTTIIAINNQKGGVAKTTTCLSLGACLAERGRSVLLIDLDPQAHLTLSLGLAPDQLRRTVADALLGHHSLVGVSTESNIFGLDIVPASRELALIDKILYQRPGYEYTLKKRLAGMNGDCYDYVLLDCAPAFGTLTLNGITAAHQLLIPTQCEYLAARSLSQIVKLARLIRRKSNPGLTYRILITMYDRRNKISRLMLAQMQREVPQLLYETIIGIDTRLRESPAFGQPITRYAPATRSTRQYRALAQELLAYERQKSTG